MNSVGGTVANPAQRDKRKVAIAARLREETPMTLKWIAKTRGDGQREQCG